MFTKYFIFSLFLASQCWAAKPLNLDQLQRKISDFILKKQAVKESGIAIAIIKNNKVVFEKGYGYSDRKKMTTVTAHTLFGIGSNTKTFTSAALAMLREEGRVDFDRPVKFYLPDFELSDPNVTERMTLTDILSHRSGLPRHDSLWYYTPFTRQELYGRLKYLELNPRPDLGFRKGFQYNNLMYMTAGLVVERLSGLNWEDFVSQRMMQPLGMTETNMSTLGLINSADFALPYVGERELSPKIMNSVGPAGSINSNLFDLEKWIKFLLAKGRASNGQVLLTPSSLDLVTTPLTDASKTTGGYSTSYGLGWFVSQVDGKKLFYHGGNIDGYSTFISFMPEEQLGVIVLTNQNNATSMEFPIFLPAKEGGAEFIGLPYVIYDSLLGPTLPSFHDLQIQNPFLDIKGLGFGALSLNSDYSEVTPFTSVRSPEDHYANSEYIGQFNENAYGEVVVSESEGQLMLNYYGQVVRLYQQANDVFNVQFASPDVADTTITVIFRRRAGRVVSVDLTLEPQVNPIQFTRVQ